MTDLLLDDRELLDAYRLGKKWALERVYREYLPTVAGFLRRGFAFDSQGKRLLFSGYDSPDDLQDVLQETFLLAFGQGARHGYNGLSSFRAYLLGIAKNVVLGRFRKDMKRLERFTFQSSATEAARDEELSRLDVQASGQTPADDDYVRMRIRRAVEKCARDLGEQQRQVLKLHYLNELSQDATAEALSISRNRVRKHLRTIRKRLLIELKMNDLDHEGKLPLKSLREED